MTVVPSKPWNTLSIEEYEEADFLQCWYETLIASGVKIEQGEDGKWFKYAPDGTLEAEGKFKDDAAMRKSWVPRYHYDLGAAWYLMPHPHVGQRSWYWNILPAVNGWWTASVTYRSNYRKIEASAPTPAEAILKLFWMRLLRDQ